MQIGCPTVDPTAIARFEKIHGGGGGGERGGGYIDGPHTSYSGISPPL